MQAYIENRHIIKKNNDIVIIPKRSISKVNDAVPELEEGLRGLEIC